MDVCPLVKLTKNRRTLKKFEETGRVALPLSDWLRFFEALTFLDREGGQREIYCIPSGAGIDLFIARSIPAPEGTRF
jgi:hypothetical protein